VSAVTASIPPPEQALPHVLCPRTASVSRPPKRDLVGTVVVLFSISLIITSLLLVLLVLLHKGKGGGLSDMFGGGISSSLGGSSVVERNLDRLTIGIGLIWIASIVALGLLLKP
jgi:preprotein translocase subunit SecG